MQSRSADCFLAFCHQNRTRRIVSAIAKVVVVLLLTLSLAQGASAITHIQQASSVDMSNKTYTSFSATFGSPTTSGNAIIVGITYGNVNATITATDTSGNAYFQAVKTWDSAHRQGSAILYALNVTGSASNRVAVQFSSSVAYLVLGIHEYNGLASASALDVAVGRVGSGSSVTSGPSTTAAGGDLIFGVGVEDAIGSGVSLAAGTGFTKRVDLASAASYADEDMIQSSAGSMAATWTLSPASDWIANMAAFNTSGVGSTAPTITTLSPTSGLVGASVTITGANFGATQGNSRITFNGTTASTSSWSGTGIVAPVPAGATAGNVVVTVNGQASNGVNFSVTAAAAPSITTLSPSTGPVGTSVTITGASFGSTQGSSTVSFNGTTASPTSWSSASIVAPVPSGTTTGNVVVTVNGQASNGVNFSVTTAAAPSITNLSPTSGPVGTSVTITGANFGSTQGNSRITFNGRTASPTSWSSATIVAPVPSRATAGNVVVTVNGQASNGVNFSVTAAAVPSITNLSPTSGPMGTPVTIAGANFGSTQGSSTVTFNGTATSPTSWSSASIVAPVPSGATAGNVVVTVSGQASNGVNFSVTTAAVPSITNLSPTSGPVGTSVTITGANFGSTQGSSTVTFNGTTASPTSWSGTSIVAPVPSGATTGNVVVTVNGQASNGVNFSVTTAAAPSITNLSPTSGPVGTSVTITGANFGGTQGSSTVTFNGTTASPTSWSSASIVAPVPSGATAGNVVVAVSGQAGNGVNFSVTATAVPSITNLSPSTGPVGTPVTITGANFGGTQGSSTVTFNGTTASPTSWSGTSIVTAVPSGATAGNVVVTVNGQASNGVNFSVTAAAVPSITNLSPTSGPMGTPVTIAGANFGSTQGSSTVTFNGTATSPTSWSSASIVAPVPSGATAGNVVVTVSGQASNGVNFSVTTAAVPSITNLSPPSGTVGTSVTIAGANFGSTQGSSTVTFNGTTASPTSWSGTSIVAPVPSGATAGNVVVTVNGQASNGIQFGVTNLVTAAPTMLQWAGCINTSSQTVSGGSGNSYKCRLPNNAQAGNALVAWFIYNGPAITTTVSDDQSNSWTQGRCHSSASNGIMCIYFASNSAANTREVRIGFSSPENYVGAGVAEFNNVAIASALDTGDAGADGSGKSISAGTMAPSQNGDLLIQAAFDGTSPMSPGSSDCWDAGSQSNITWKLTQSDCRDSLAMQWGQYNSANAISPSMTMGPTGDSWSTVAIALKTTAAGAGRPSGMYVVGVEHTEMTFNSGGQMVQEFASEGNLIVISYVGSAHSPSDNDLISVTDSQGNSYTRTAICRNNDNAGVSRIAYAGNATTSNHLNIALNLSNSGDATALIYDVVNAGASPFDNSQCAFGDTSASNFTGVSITPSTSNGLIISVAPIYAGVATGCTSTSCLYDTTNFTGESSPTQVDQNDPYGHYYNSNTGTYTFSWSADSDIAHWASLAVAFKP